jgi:hypothetical protein
MDTPPETVQEEPKSHSGDRECFCFVVGCSGLLIFFTVLLVLFWAYGEYMAGSFGAISP